MITFHITGENRVKKQCIEWQFCEIYIGKTTNGFLFFFRKEVSVARNLGGNKNIIRQNSNTFLKFIIPKCQ